MEVNPLNIFFVKSDSKGDRLLFRYPYTTENKDEGKQKKCGRHNPYAVSFSEDLLQNPQSQTSNICKGQLSGFTDEMLSTLFAVKAELCNRKFELKVNDVRFVGHPTLLPYRTNKDDTGAAASIVTNIVFALQASASHSIVKCYYDLSRRLGIALRHEEKRCSYLNEEMKIMLAAHDEVSALDSEMDGDNDEEEDNLRHSVSSTTHGYNEDATPKSAFHLILQRSSLATSMKAVFEDLTTTGIVQVRINNWVLLSFCLPHKAHQIHNRGLIIEPETIDKCLQKLRPYHGILLLVNPNDLLASIPLDGSSALVRLIKLYSPLKSLQTLAIEADLTLKQVSQLTGHLVYWAKATVIFPLCEGNVYVVSPGANVHTHSPLVQEFADQFPGMCLLQMLSEFSLPAPLWYVTRSARCGGVRLARCVAWLLQRRLLLQLHTYVQFNSSHWGPHKEGKEYYCEKHKDIYNQSCNVSMSSLNHTNTQLNVPEPLEARDPTNIFHDSDDDYPTENNLNQTDPAESWNASKDKDVDYSMETNLNKTDFSHTKPIVIESDYTKFDKFHEVDSANHSFDDGVDVVDGIKPNGIIADYEKEPNKTQKKPHANSVDSGISNNINGTTENGDQINGNLEKPVKSLPSRLSDISLKESTLQSRLSDISLKENTLPSRLSDISLKENTLPSRLSDISLKESEHSNGHSENSHRETSSDEDKFESDQDVSPRTRVNGKVNGTEKKNGVSLNLKLQSEMSFQPPTVWTVPSSCEAGAGGAPSPPADALLDTFTAEERAALAPAHHHHHADLLLLATLHNKGYLRGEQHLEEIMFMENVSRSQLMQLLDKFKDVLITFETEDPAVAMLYPYQ